MTVLVATALVPVELGRAGHQDISNTHVADATTFTNVGESLKISLRPRSRPLTWVNDGRSDLINPSPKVPGRFKLVYQTLPFTVKTCANVDVPIYGQMLNQANQADIILGGLVGAVVGNQMGGGDGKSAMTGIAAIFGATYASMPRTKLVVTGWRTEKQCKNSTKYRTVKKMVNY